MTRNGRFFWSFSRLTHSQRVSFDQEILVDMWWYSICSRLQKRIILIDVNSAKTAKIRENSLYVRYKNCWQHSTVSELKLGFCIDILTRTNMTQQTTPTIALTQTVHPLFNTRTYHIFQTWAVSNLIISSLSLWSMVLFLYNYGSSIHARISRIRSHGTRKCNAMFTSNA